MTNTSNLPIEALESEYPLMIERYEFVKDSGGAGKYRGGLGIRRDYRPINHDTTFSGQGERFVNKPWGIFGGYYGGTGQFSIIPKNGKKIRIANKPSALKIGPNSVISVVTAGAGGYGNPKNRSKKQLKDDFNSGKFSKAYLLKNYPQTKKIKFEDN